MIKIIIVTLVLFVGSVFGYDSPLSGRVTNNGVGLGNTKITIVAGDCVGWVNAYALTNPYGYYSIMVRGDCTFAVMPSHKSHLCFQPSGYIFLNNPLNPTPEFTNIDFAVADESFCE